MLSAMKENTSENLAKERPKRVLGEGLSKEVLSEGPKEEISRVPGLGVTTGWR